MSLRYKCLQFLSLPLTFISNLEKIFSPSFLSLGYNDTWNQRLICHWFGLAILPALWHKHIHTHTLSLSHTHKHTFSYINSQTLSLSLSHRGTHTNTQSLFHTHFLLYFTYTQILSFFLSHTHIAYFLSSVSLT